MLSLFSVQGLIHLTSQLSYTYFQIFFSFFYIPRVPRRFNEAPFNANIFNIFFHVSGARELHNLNKNMVPEVSEKWKFYRIYDHDVLGDIDFHNRRKIGFKCTYKHNGEIF